jgi:hypothetical protein
VNVLKCILVQKVGFLKHKTYVKFGGKNIGIDITKWLLGTQTVIT